MKSDTIPVLPHPRDLGLPAKFGRWRAGQAEAAVRALDSPKRFVVLGMPTGFGKSLVYMAAGLLDKPTAILTSTKGLQTQLTTDFADAGLVDVRGMGNYICREIAEGQLIQIKGKQHMCDEGPCLAGYKCARKGDDDTGIAELGDCDYFSAQRLARQSHLLVTNYSYWMAVHGNADRPAELGEDGEWRTKKPKLPLGYRGLLVMDEAHAAVDELGDYLAIEIGHWEVEGVLGKELPHGDITLGAWQEWAGHMAGEAMRLHTELAGQIRLGYGNNPKNLSRLRELRDLIRRLGNLVKANGEWVEEVNRDRRGRRVVRFDPVWPGEYAEGSLFRGVDKVVLTSATIRPKTLNLLGVKPADYEFMEYPSSFPVERRPFIYLPTVRMRFDMEPGSLRLWVSKIDAILRNRRDRKGIIHTISYDRRDYILRYSEFASQMYTHNSGELQSAVERFRRAGPGAIFVSPSVSTGFDFPGEDCRYQIIGKVPFPPTQSKVLKARGKRDPQYFAYVAAQALVQAAGRGMRSADDWSETFIIDDQWSWFRNKFKEFLPEWFRAACRHSNTIPPPLAY